MSENNGTGTGTGDDTGSGTGTGTAPGANGAQGGSNGSGEGQSGGNGQGGAQGGSESPNAEAARYRTALRTAEGERDTLRTRLVRAHTREIERVAAEELAEPADLLALSGKGVADLLNGDGDVNADAVREAARALTANRPGLRSSAAARRGGGIGGGKVSATGRKARTGKGWASALRGEQR